MFIRRTQTRSTASGEVYFTYRLVRSERVDSKVRQRTLLNLGRHFEIAQPHWPALCRRVEEILTGQLALEHDATAGLETHAQRIAAQLLARAGAPGEGPDIQRVDVDSLELIRPRSVGVEHVGLWAMDQLGLRARLQQLPVPASLGAVAIGSVIARMARPGSERATRRWLGERSALGELLGVDFETMGAMQLYRASDALMAHREAIERDLFDRAMGLFDLHPTVTLYDLTNTYFEGEAARQPKAKRGHSKDKRTDCPLLTLALVLDASGFVRRSKVFAGNVREHHTVADMLEALDAPREALVVMDRGIATEERVQWLDEHRYRYLVVSRERIRQFDPEAAQRIETASRHGVHLHKVVSEDGREARLFCFSEERADKERAIVDRFARRFETALTGLSNGLSRPRTRKRVDQVWERIGRLKANNRRVAQHYDVELDTDPTGERATAVRFTRRPLEGSMMTHPGVYCLRTNQTLMDGASAFPPGGHESEMPRLKGRGSCVASSAVE